MTGYDDGTEVEIETEAEDSPRSGEWVDQEDFYINPTVDELAEGHRLGRNIDVDDDEDNGLQ